MPGSPVIPGLRYADAPAAIAFLCSAFGFEVRASYEDQDDPTIVHHAELVLGDGMIMLGTRARGRTNRYIAGPPRANWGA
ncbi:putative glyoxalase superfamily protein PhnB [Sphingobium vermicomposti]|uniref:Putative glyoxalase superfamily protein PhnB n=1 Tax=Sphingobium vermicomposti TaxID=529005 RepID=A0A846MGV5_9SPHN|nr:putative glyoxalase superfamily protein PhnB [Sphingobium vermicomposti]